MTLKLADLSKIGYVSRVHGVAGEVEVKFGVEYREMPGFLFLLLDGLPVPFELGRSRRSGRGAFIIRFVGIGSCEQASELCGCDVLCPPADIPELLESEGDWSEFCGFAACDSKIGLIGSIDSVESATANVLLRVRSPRFGEVYIPFHRDLVESIDRSARLITFNLPDGLLSINQQ